MKFEITVDLTQTICLWKGGKYKFTFNVLRTYPHDAPKCHCDTPIYHPNIDFEGKVDLTILRSDWKPWLSLNDLILGLVSLFIEPNPFDPLNHEAGKLMISNYSSF